MGLRKIAGAVFIGAGEGLRNALGVKGEIQLPANGAGSRLREGRQRQQNRTKIKKYPKAARRRPESRMLGA